jgi:hypothetical protein
VSTKSAKYSLFGFILENTTRCTTLRSIFNPGDTSAIKSLQNTTYSKNHRVNSDGIVTGAYAQRCPFFETDRLFKTRSLVTTACCIYFINQSANIFSRFGDKVGTRKLSAHVSVRIGKWNFVGGVTGQTL